MKYEVDKWKIDKRNMKIPGKTLFSTLTLVENVGV